MTSAAKVTPTTSGGRQKTGRSKKGETTEERHRCVRRMSRGKWHRSCPKQRTDVEAPFETDGGKVG